MPEARETISGEVPIEGVAQTTGSVRVTPLGLDARFSLRLHAEVAARVGAVEGFQLDLAINRCAMSHGRLSARLGPNEWLLIGRPADSECLGDDLAGALGEVFHSIVDIGHRDIAIIVEGPYAREILNAAGPLDLCNAAFPAGAATRTLFGKSEIVLLRPTAEPAFFVECWRSFAPYVLGLLEDAASEFDSPQSDQRS